MTINEVLNKYEIAHALFKDECKLYADLQKNVIDPFNLTDEEELMLFRAKKRYSAACRKFHLDREECRAQMMLLLKRDIGKSHVQFEEQRLEQAKRESWSNTDWFKEMKAKLEKQENEKKEGE